MANPDPLLSYVEAALYLGGISALTVKDWSVKGKLAKVHIGRRAMIRQSELDRFIAAGSKPLKVKRPKRTKAGKKKARRRVQ